MALPAIFMTKSAIFLLGAATGVALTSATPAVGNIVRPLARETIKGGLLLGRKMRALIDDVREGIEDVTAEAQADLDAESDKNENGTSGNGVAS